MSLITSKAIYKVYIGDINIYTAEPDAVAVNYLVDTGVVYTEKVNIGASCLSPTTFVPYKEGWTFVGWKEDTTANSDVLTERIADNQSITLYAVFSQIITLSYNGNGSTSGSTTSQTGSRYYNNGSIVNPTFTLKANGFTKTNYTFIKWASGSASGTQYAVGASVTLTASTAFYAYWVQTVTSFGYTGGIQSFTAPIAGTYKLVCYGAQGGTANATAGGKGGYAYGNVKLTKGQVIYIVVGGQGASSAASEGSTTKTKAGGYNGGGSSSRHVYSNDEDFGFQQAWLGGGGGCTHIGTFNKTLAAQGSTSSLFIVAGGGGGAVRTSSGAYAGGAGGGTSGGNGTSFAGNYVGKGGSQTAAGSVSYPDLGTNKGGFGKGDSASAQSSYSNAIGGGGGGLYGGGAAWGGSGAGGSGYIGGCISGTTGMSNGQGSGNGSASITFVSAS